MDTGGLIIIFRKIGDLEDAFCRPYIFRRRSQRVAATVSQTQYNSETVTLSTLDSSSIKIQVWVIELYYTDKALHCIVFYYSDKAAAHRNISYYITKPVQPQRYHILQSKMKVNSLTFGRGQQHRTGAYHRTSKKHRKSAKLP